MPKIYINCLQLLRSFAFVYGPDTNLILNPGILSFYNFDFLFSLFNINSDYQSNKTNNSVDIELNDYSLVQTKINCLYFFRKFYILPMLGFKKWHNVYTDFENITPLHRLIFRKSISDFFNLTKIDKKMFLKLINRIHISIFEYSDKMQEKLLSSLLIEYYKWMILLISLKYNSYSNEESSLYHNLIEKISKIIELVKNKKSFEHIIKKYSEIFLFKVMINTNDEVFYENVFKGNCLDESKKQTKNEDILNNSKRQLLNSDRYMELVEEEDENFSSINQQYQNLENKKSDKLFCFENSPFQLNILKSLFPYKKLETDTTNEIKVGEIYDILSNKNDYYIEQIKNLVEIDQNFQKDFLNFDLKLLMIQMTNPNFTELVQKKIFKKLEEEIIIKTIKDDLEIMETNRRKYYDSNINENVLLNLCTKFCDGM